MSVCFELKSPTRHGFDVTARIRLTTTPLHFGGSRVWMLCCRETAVQVRRRVIEVPSTSVRTPVADWAGCSAEDAYHVPQAALGAENNPCSSFNVATLLGMVSTG